MVHLQQALHVGCAMGEEPTTGEFEAILKDRYPNLDHHWIVTWLDDLNEAVVWLKQKISGNARMCVPWSGGQPGKVQWEAPIKPPGKKRKRT